MKKFFLILVTALLGVSVFVPGLSHAATVNYNDVLDDAIFDNANTMSAAQIDAFLNTFSNSCISTNNGFSAPDVTGYTPQTSFRYGSLVSAGTVIYHAAQAYGINPQVILTTLQKEQGLVRGDGANIVRSGPDNKNCGALAISASMGYNCPDSLHLTSYSGFALYAYRGTAITSVNNTCVEHASYVGFSRQVIIAAWQLTFDRHRSEGQNNWYVNKTNWDNSDDLGFCYSQRTVAGGPFYLCPDQVSHASDPYISHSGKYPIDDIIVTIQNGATAALYNYTPHKHGQQLFTDTFTGWFGPTHAFIYNGINYSSVFDPEYYLDNNPDLKAAFGDNQREAFNHFIYYGMKEGRVANANFDVTSYRNRYQDLRWAFGTNLPAYYLHYITTGRFEGRTATGAATLQPVSSYNHVDYSAIYNFSTYLADNPAGAPVYANDDTGALLSFLNRGMSEGRQASADFNVNSYRDRYADLRAAFGNNLRLYYLHYLYYGKSEGRIGTGDYLGGTTVLNGVDYSAIYNFDYYEKNNPDIQKAFGLNDKLALEHFVDYGMSEGRQASADFNVNSYRDRYADLRAAFGNNLRLYYLHYLYYGKSEGRIGT